MKIGVECIPCFVRQAFEAVSLVTDNEMIKERILRQVVYRLANESFDKTPPSVGGDIHRIIRCLSGDCDPYLDIKKDANALVMGLMPSLEQRIQSSPDPFETAVRLAIAGNIIDCAQGNHVGKQEVNETVSQCLDQPIRKDTIKELGEEIRKASNIMYLGDNAGEVFFDRLLIEQLKGYPITFVVRGAPTINDALRDDARIAGLDTLVKVIDNGSDAPGTILEECSEEFRSNFEEADLIIAKGQGNYETLSDGKKTIFFLLKAKCPAIAKHIGCREEDMVVVKNG
jgi:uncharacterized protein with ATP-grasp and redox domains